MCIIVGGTLVKILASEFLVVKEAITKHRWGLFWETRCICYGSFVCQSCYTRELYHSEWTDQANFWTRVQITFSLPYLRGLGSSNATVDLLVTLSVWLHLQRFTDTVANLDDNYDNLFFLFSLAGSKAQEQTRGEIQYQKIKQAGVVNFSNDTERRAVSLRQPSFSFRNAAWFIIIWCLSRWLFTVVAGAFVVPASWRSVQRAGMCRRRWSLRRRRCAVDGRRAAVVCRPPTWCRHRRHAAGLWHRRWVLCQVSDLAISR